MIYSKNVCKIDSKKSTVERITVQEFLSFVPKDPEVQVHVLSILLQGLTYHYAGYQYLIKELVQKKVEETKKLFSAAN